MHKSYLLDLTRRAKPCARSTVEPNNNAPELTRPVALAI
jgi:hypothetical protein